VNDFQWLDATGQAELVRTGKASATELVTAAIDQIERLNPKLNAVCYERLEQALDEARTHPAGKPFSGVPTLIKHTEAVAGEPLDRSATVLKEAGIVASEDSIMARKIRDAGFISLGRSSAPEIAIVSTTESKAYGVTRNPWRLDLTSGGSSGGASAAVAAGMVPVAQGGDGGGSIRMPAAFTNLVGLKPSLGLVDVGAPRLWGHSTPSVLTHTVRDTAAIFDAWSVGAQPGSTRISPRREGLVSALGREPGLLRIGVLDHAPGHAGPLHPAVREAVRDTAVLLERAGHHVEEAYPEAFLDPRCITAFFDAISVCVAQGVDAARAAVKRQVAIEEFDAVTGYWDHRGRELTGLDLANALSWQDDLRLRMGRWWAGGFDLLLCPVFSTPPRKLGWPWAKPGGIKETVDVLTYTAPVNTSGQPAISLPAAVTAEHEPIGVQLVAAFGRDDLLIQIAAQLEQLRPWAHKHPDYVAGGRE
jgi:amidase